MVSIKQDPPKDETTSQHLAAEIAAAAEAKKAAGVVTLDLRGVVTYTDYCVICSGNTNRQTRAIATAIRDKMKDQYGLAAHDVEGEEAGDWVLMDYIDVVVHIFTPELRKYYRLERLWGDVPAVRSEHNA